MQGVKKFFPNEEASVQSIIAGNDMLCLPGDIPLSIQKIKTAIKQKKISWEQIEQHCKKVLLAKYQLGLTQSPIINTQNLTEDLNSKIANMRKTVAENAITLLAKQNDAFFPLSVSTHNKAGDVAVVAIGTSRANEFCKQLISDYNAGVYYFDFNKTTGDADALFNTLKSKYKKNYCRYPQCFPLSRLQFWH